VAAVAVAAAAAVAAAVQVLGFELMDGCMYVLIPDGNKHTLRSSVVVRAAHATDHNNNVHVLGQDASQHCTHAGNYYHI
jgi:hypothetical protein